MKFIRKQIINETASGFMNPFADFEDPANITGIDVEGDHDDPLYKKYQRSKLPILGVKLHNPNTKNKVVYSSDRMFAGQYFEPGDTVEIAPYKLLHDEDMYSRSIRDCSFVIDKSRGLYAFPLGYAICYRNSIDSGLPGNIEYEIDEENNIIKITAITRIKRGKELIFAATGDDFANEIQPGQFQYEQGPEPVYSINKIQAQ